MLEQMGDLPRDTQDAALSHASMKVDSWAMPQRSKRAVCIQVEFLMHRISDAGHTCSVKAPGVVCAKWRERVPGCLQQRRLRERALCRRQQQNAIRCKERHTMQA